jgi:hypothetical protein
MRLAFVTGVLLVLVLAACGGATTEPDTSQTTATETTPVSNRATPTARGEANPEMFEEKYGSYSLEQAEREGYTPDGFCLAAADFGLPAELGAMGFHATDATRLDGPVEADRPQAILFDAEGRVIAVEYEVMADATPTPPELFGQTFKKLPPHPGVEHEHYALHLWFLDNPSGQFADFNPAISCPAGSGPSSQAAPAHGCWH